MKIAEVAEDVSYVRFAKGKPTITTKIGEMSNENEIYADFDPNGHFIGVIVLAGKKQ